MESRRQENYKDTVFVEITVSPQLLIKFEISKDTLTSLLESKLLSLQSEYAKIFRLVMTVSFPTILCMAGCPHQYGSAGSLTPNPCDAVLIKVEARCGNDINPGDLTAISSSIVVVLSTNCKIDESLIFDFTGGVNTGWSTNSGVGLNSLKTGDRVLAKNKSYWVSGEVVGKDSPDKYLIRVGGGKVWLRHVNLLKREST